MLTNFKSDLVKGHRAEQIVKEVFSSLTDKYTFTDVSCDPQYYYKGDIMAVAADGKQTMIEVKNDGRIHETNNILCEEEVFMKEGGYFTKGNMYSDYEIFCIVSEPGRKIYVIDFKVLKEIYKKGQYKRIDHPQQFSDCYLLDVGTLKKYGGLIEIIKY